MYELPKRLGKYLEIPRTQGKIIILQHFIRPLYARRYDFRVIGQASMNYKAPTMTPMGICVGISTTDIVGRMLLMTKSHHSLSFDESNVSNNTLEG